MEESTPTHTLPPFAPRGFPSYVPCLQNTRGYLPPPVLVSQYPVVKVTRVLWKTTPLRKMFDFGRSDLFSHKTDVDRWRKEGRRQLLPDFLHEPSSWSFDQLLPTLAPDTPNLVPFISLHMLFLPQPPLMLQELEGWLLKLLSSSFRFLCFTSSQMDSLSFVPFVIFLLPTFPQRLLMLFEEIHSLAWATHYYSFGRSSQVGDTAAVWK